MSNEDPPKGVSRRSFLQAVGLGATSAALPPEGLLGQAAPAPQDSVDRLGPGAVPIRLKVNGAEVNLRVEPRVTLLDALRNHLQTDGSEPTDLTGTKRVCDRGTCGACTVLLDGRTVYACTVLAVEAQGSDIQTIEGLGKDGKLHPVQEEILHTDGLMCGFCTPGYVMVAATLLASNPSPTRAEIQEAFDGNICRCGSQPRALEAVERAARRMKEGR